MFHVTATFVIAIDPVLTRLICNGQAPGALDVMVGQVYVIV